VKEFKLRTPAVDSFGSWLGRGWSLSPVVLLSALEIQLLNSRYTDEQPALSGNRRFLAFVSNRNGSRNILMYDLQQQHLISLPRLNRRESIAESPSLSHRTLHCLYCQ